MNRSGQIHLLQIEPKVVWDSTEAEMNRREQREQSETIDRLLDSALTLHIATRYDSLLTARRVTCAEVRRGRFGEMGF